MKKTSAYKTKTASAKKMMNGGKAMKKPSVKKAQEGLKTGSTTTSGRGPNRGSFVRKEIGIATDKMPANNKWGYKFVPSDEELEWRKWNGVSNTPPPKEVKNSKWINDGQFNKKEQKSPTDKSPSKIIKKSSSPKPKMVNGGKVKK